MNKRIRLLAEQAKESATRRHPISNIVLTCDSYMAEQEFARLIIQECVDLFVDRRYMILNPHEPFANERVRALKEHDKDTVKTIKEHFGVEG
jgi:hypothetical protein